MGAFPPPGPEYEWGRGGRATRRGPAPANAGEPAATTRPPLTNSIGTRRLSELLFIGDSLRGWAGLTLPCRNRSDVRFTRLTLDRGHHLCEPVPALFTTGRCPAAIGCRPTEEASMTFGRRRIRICLVSAAAAPPLAVALAVPAAALDPIAVVPSGSIAAVDVGAGNQTDAHVA